jgi:N-acetyl-anhydromuramyl-L-alanine amidase AmpD
MTAAALLCWALLPKPVPAGGTVDALSGTPALQTIIWPREMAPGRAWRFIIIHHSAAAAAPAKASAPGRPEGPSEDGVPYHFIIHRAAGPADGQVTATQQWIEQLDGASGRPTDRPDLGGDGIHICLVGDFDHQKPTARQMTSLQLLVMSLRDRYNIPLELIVGHSEINNTHCPGMLFPMEAFLMDVREAYLMKRIRGGSGEAP